MLHSSKRAPPTARAPGLCSYVAYASALRPARSSQASGGEHGFTPNSRGQLSRTTERVVLSVPLRHFLSLILSPHAGCNGPTRGQTKTSFESSCEMQTAGKKQLPWGESFSVDWTGGCGSLSALGGPSYARKDNTQNCWRRFPLILWAGHPRPQRPGDQAALRDSEERL